MDLQYAIIMPLVTWHKFNTEKVINSTRRTWPELIADECVNCNEAECVGRSTQDSLDGVSLKEATVKRFAHAIL